MNAFFKPWRRKVGVVTLVLSCVFMGGLIRSTVIRDNIDFVTSSSTLQIISSSEHYLVLASFQHLKQEHLPEFSGWSTEPISENGEFEKWHDDKSKKWVIRFCGFAIRTAENPLGTSTTGKSEITFVVVSYWSIVIPLTLLSAWLLLSKPRQPKPTREPAT